MMRTVALVLLCACAVAVAQYTTDPPGVRPVTPTPSYGGATLPANMVTNIARAIAQQEAAKVTNNLTGEVLGSGTINSNKLDAATRALLGTGGGSPVAAGSNTVVYSQSGTSVVSAVVGAADILSLSNVYHPKFTTLAGTVLTDGTVNSNKLDAATRALFGVGGGTAGTSNYYTLIITPDLTITNNLTGTPPDGGGGNPLEADADAVAFLERASITDSTISNAVQNFVIALKATNLWAKAEVIYPFVGLNATAQSKNLKKDQYNATFSGTGLTHDTYGVTGDGASYGVVTGLALTTCTNWGVDSGSIGFYGGTQSPTDNVEFMGGYNWTDTTGRAGMDRVGGNIAVNGLNSTEAQMLGMSASGDFRGFVLASRTNSTHEYIMIRATSTVGARASAQVGAHGIAFMGRMDGIAGSVDALMAINYRGLWVGAGLTIAEGQALTKCWDDFQTALSRKVP